MKNTICTFLLLIPGIILGQDSTYVFELEIEGDSSINFISRNTGFYNYLYENIDNNIERGLFPNERTYVNFWVTKDGLLDSIAVNGSYDNFNQEITRAMQNINMITISDVEYTTRIELILIIARWKEAGEFSVNGGILSVE